MSFMAADPQPQRPSRILVVDDHSIVRHGLVALLSKEKDLVVCGEAAGCEEARAAVEAQKPDLLVVDITLKDGNGLDLIRETRAANPQIKALVLSMHDEALYAEKALRAGARGYVMKENADEDIVEAIRTILRGELYISTEVSAQMLREYIGEAAERTGIESLTERELEIFECIGQGLASRKIAEKFGLSTRTVEVHRSHIKRKLQCEDAAQLVREAVRWVEQRNG
jgi:DNA-binding NarL/FixJ family response regulator